MAKFWNKKEKTDQDAVRSTEGMNEQPEDPDGAIPAPEPEHAAESEQAAEQEQTSEPKEMSARDHIRELEQLLGMETEKQEKQVPEQQAEEGAPAAGDQTTEESSEPPILDLKVSSNGMRAVLEVTLHSLNQKVTPEEILAFLEKNKICYGILEEEIREYCRQANFSQSLVCAVGKQVLDENDGRIEYHFETDKVLRPIQRKDGSLDYRELGLVKNISKGDSLCALIMPKPGSDGMDVYGKVVPYRKGTVPALPVGVNTQLSEDGQTLISTVDGTIEILPNAINVNEIFIVKGDVGRDSGNVSAKCSVLIQGDVKSGFSVSAGGDITVRGIVEHANLEAGGNIVISQGMNGGGRGRLKAGGNISGKFFENAILDAQHEIYASIIMSSSVRAGGSLILNKDIATLAGGECTVGCGVYAKNIGNPSGSVTKVRIESRELNSLLTETSKKLKNPEVLLHELDNARREMREFEDQFERLHQQFLQQHPEDDGSQFEQVNKAAEKKRIQFSKKIEELEEQHQLSEASLNSFLSFSIIAKGMAYPGTKIEIAGYTYNVVKETSCAKFYLSYGKIEWRPATPADTPDTVKH
ncbi:FapA family protein [Faecalispora sporosphaeroides]|uniref:FapA family protein n=1 Tax=Faecalispora sporosphaeroides TaxID=1549 RepID=UPI002DD64EA9|nr:FapA family protein [Faecalispora sporosphaeroides]